VADDERVRVLVLCHANVARSVAAAALLQGVVDERGIAIELRTAGTHATDGQPVSERTVTAFEKVAGRQDSMGSHRARQLSDVDVEWADLIIAMEDSQVRFVRRLHPGASDHVATLGSLATDFPVDGRRFADRVASLRLAQRGDFGEGDVEDPAGGDDAAYERTMAALVEQCGELARRISG
jgi:protein-tyrosine phosphatase